MPARCWQQHCSMVNWQRHERTTSCELRTSALDAVQHNTGAVQIISCSAEAAAAAPVGQKTSQYVDCKGAQASNAFYPHDGLNTLVQNGVASIPGTLCVGCDLGKDVAHLVTGISMAFAQHTQKPQHLPALPHAVSLNAEHIFCWWI